MTNLGGAEQFQQLGPSERKRYKQAAREMIRLAEGYAIPIIFAPPLSVGGTINGATGCIIDLDGRYCLLTASHVLEGFENRTRAGEVLNWQVGALPPFDPLCRITWRSTDRDLLFLRLTKDEAVAACGTGSRIVPTLTGWPPKPPTSGQVVLVAGFPRALREVTTNDQIGAGPFGAMFRIANAKEGYCDCQIEDRDLIGFDDSRLPPPDADMGGLSGGPVFCVGTLSYPLIGVVTDHCRITLAEFQLLRIATLNGIADSALT
jgi:hypothetical protein